MTAARMQAKRDGPSSPMQVRHCMDRELSCRAMRDVPRGSGRETPSAESSVERKQIVEKKMMKFMLFLV